MKTGIFKTPEPAKVNILSLGAGVQSSAMALMASKGEIKPMPDCAIFADTGAEPQRVYKWLDWLKDRLTFPVHVVSAGSLTQNSTRPRISAKTGLVYLSHNVPAFTVNEDGGHGQYRRQCTDKQKIRPLTKEANRIRNRQRCIMWIGISTDEIQRVAINGHKMIVNRWPLIEHDLTRSDCIRWMNSMGYPEPPRSACVYCPYHSDSEWLKLKIEDPDGWQQALDYEKDLQAAAESIPRLTAIPFLHPKRIPLSGVNFKRISAKNIEENSFQNECEGMCGM